MTDPIAPGEPRRPHPASILAAKAALLPLQRWHGHRVEGLEHIPREGPALVVVHHTLATYDAFLFGMAVFDTVDRPLRGLGDDQLFRLPGVRDWLHDMGIRPASPGAALALLRRGDLVFVAPGGMREALRPREARYRTRWEDRFGFVRLALRARVPVILAATPAADRIYSVFANPITDLVYEQLHLPLVVARGLGPTALPRPVRLTTYVAPPIAPPDIDPDDEDGVRSWHAELTHAMHALLARDPKAARALERGAGRAG